MDRPALSEAALDGDVTCGVVVIGGGLGGMSAALRLAELGEDVVLVESDLCGWGASARNAGYVTPTLGNDPRILKRFYGDRVRGLYRFANNSVTFTEDLIASRGIDCGYRATGNINVAPTAAAFRSMQATAKSSRRAVVADAAELGIPSTFPGGIHLKVGGILNPGQLALGMRGVVLASPVRVYEQSHVDRVVDDGASVTVRLAQGTIRAERAVLTNNAFINDLDLAPRNLATPVWVTAVETEPVSSERLDAAGWLSRTPMTTAHLVMQSFRPTDRGTVVFTSRRLQMSGNPRRVRLPDQSVVEDLARGFRERFPGLADVAPARTWGGWIGVTPAQMAVVGQVTPRVSYSLACSGHGLPQAPYLGTLLADHLCGKGKHEDLTAVWRETPRFAPGVVHPVSLRMGWLADRMRDRWDGLRGGGVSR